MRSDDTGTWFERWLREPSFVIPEISDFRRQRGVAREREGAFGNAATTAGVRYFLVTKHYRGCGRYAPGNPPSDPSRAPEPGGVLARTAPPSIGKS